MFKIVHSKTSAPEEDIVRILDNVEETSLSNAQDEDEEEDKEDTCVIEQEYVHPDTDEYLDVDDDDEDTINSTENHEGESEPPPRIATPRCACSYKGIHKITFGLRKCLHSRPCSICVYLCLTLIVLASLVSLVVISVLIVVPYAKAASYQHSNCTPVRVNVDNEDRRCSCGKGCSSLYPCIQIKVLIHAVNYSSDSHPESSILYENEAIFMRKVSYINIYVFKF